MLPLNGTAQVLYMTNCGFKYPESDFEGVRKLIYDTLFFFVISHR